MNLGELIQALKRCDQDKSVYFDFCRFAPGGLGSYRGFYEQLSFEPIDNEAPKAKEVLEMCVSAVGKSFDGYKGGSYRMSEETPIWVDRYGDCTSTKLVGLEEKSWAVILKTEFQDV